MNQASRAPIQSRPFGPGRRGVALRLTLRCGLLLAALSGCAAYRFGNQALYPPDVHTVYVPVFTSDSFRRGLGERLTEAVIKQIELKTPYKVVGSPEADSVLIGKILADTKRVVVEDQNDQPRETNVSMSVLVSWTDRKGDLVSTGSSGRIALPPDAVSLTAQTEFVPEYGQSTATSMQEVIDKIAVQIVSLMEIPW